MKEKKKTNVFKRFVSFMLAFTLVVGSMYLTPSDALAATTKLNKDSLVLVKNHGFSLKLSGNSKKVIWKTSNTSVVTFKKVSNNNVQLTAKGTGNAMVSAKVGSKTYKCSVKVINAKLNATKKTIYKGSSYTLKVSGSTAKKWVSKNTSIAIVSSSGKVTGKKAGKVRILAYVNNSILYCDFTIKNKSGNTSSDDSIMEMNGQHKTFDGLHIGDRIGYEEYCLTGRVKSVAKSASTVPVYNGKVVDIRDKEMFQKALRADKVVGQFYRDYITPDMDDIERLQAVFRFLDSRPSYLVGWKGRDCNLNGKIDKGVVDEVPANKYNGCSLCLRELKANTTMGFGFGPETQYANTAYAALYANAATNKGWAEAFELLCVAAGLDAFFCDYGFIFYPVRVRLYGYWVDITIQAAYSSGKNANKYFDFSNGGDRWNDGEIRVNGSNNNYQHSVFKCQYNHLKNYNRYSLTLPKLYIPDCYKDDYNSFSLRCQFFSDEDYEKEVAWWNEINEEYGVNHILYSDSNKNFLMYY